MRLLVFAMMVLSIAPMSAAQEEAAQKFIDPIALLQAVAKNYASASDTFRLESIIDFEMSSDLNHQWSRTYRTAIKGPGTQYRIEVRTGFGSLQQVSDGANEWVYLARIKLLCETTCCHRIGRSFRRSRIWYSAS